MRLIAATPILDRCDPEFMVALYELIGTKVVDGMVIKRHCSDISLARALLARDALDEEMNGGIQDATHILWIDSDMAFTSEQVNQLKASVEDTGADLMSAVYRKKTASTNSFPHVPMRGEGGVQRFSGGSRFLYPYLERTGFGFCILSVAALREVQTECPVTNNGITGAFCPLVRDRQPYFTEDYAFCTRLYQYRSHAAVLLDPRICVDHVGSGRFVVPKNFDPDIDL